MAYHECKNMGRRTVHMPCPYNDIPGMQLQLDYLLLSDVTKAFGLVQECTARGANVGIDEYPDEKSFRKLIEWCDVFSVKGGNTKRLQAMIAIQPSFMSRTTPVYSARIYIFCSAELDSFDAFGHLVSLGENLSRETSEYYTGSMVLIFRKCEAMLLALRRLKFLIVACLPLGGALVDIGKCETLVLYKDFVGVGPPIELPLEEQKKMLAEALGSDTPVAAADHTSFPVFASLPAEHVFRCGVRARLRMMRAEDSEAVYEMFVQAANQGRGYGEGDVFSFDLFRQFFLVDHYNVVWEIANGTRRKMLAFTAIGVTVYARTPTLTACDIINVLDPQYHGRGMGVELQIVCEQLATDVGFSCVLSDTPVVNHRVCDIISSHGYSVVGYIPNCIRMAGRGVVDLLFSYSTLDHVKSFKATHAAAPQTSKL